MVAATSILIAKLFSLGFIAIGVGGIVNKNYPKMVKDVFSNSGLVTIYGILTLVAGALIVNYHNIWEKSWVVVLTLFGWIAILKGFVLLIRPKRLEKRSQQIFKSGIGAYTAHLVLVLGVVLGYLALFA